MAEAKLNKDYALRLVGIGALMVALSIWSVYDGAVAWPGVNRRMEAVRPMLTATNLTAENWLREESPRASPLQLAFAAHGWRAPKKLVRKMVELQIPRNPADIEQALARQKQAVQRLLAGPVYAADDLRDQYIQAGITLLLALIACGIVAAKRGRRFVADEAGLHGSGFGGRDIAWSEVRMIDWTRWEEKGIVVLSLASGASVKCDSWHFSGMDGIVKVVEAQRPDLSRSSHVTSS